MCTQTKQRGRRSLRARASEDERAMWGSLRIYTHTCLHNVLIILDTQYNNNNDKGKKYMERPKDLNYTNYDVQMYNPNTQSRTMPHQDPFTIYNAEKG